MKMPAGNSYNLETLDPLSDEFYQRYGLLELSTTDTFVFNPTVWNQPDIERIEPVKVQKLTSQPLSENLTVRARKVHVPPARVRASVESPEFKVKEIPHQSQLTDSENTRDTSSIFLAVFVRLLLIGHNVMTVWRVTVIYNENLYWLIVIANILMIAEGLVTVCKRDGIDYKWWCPCFLIYLAATLPAIWLLQIRQYELAIAQNLSEDSTLADSTTGFSTSLASTDTITSTTIATVTVTTAANFTSPLIENVTLAVDNFTSAGIDKVTVAVDNFTSAAGIDNVTIAAIDNGTSIIANFTETITDNTTAAVTTKQNNVTIEVNNTTAPSLSTTLFTTTPDPSELPAPDMEVWLIIVQESLIYLLVFSRWLLPRRDMSREFLADLLLEFLAIASDIMELLAVFDESQVRENLLLTYWVMAVWSASFIQFIPVLAQKRMFRHLRSPQRKLFTRFCGDHFVEMAYTCMSILLQDGPFLILRLFIMIRLKLITYSLVFFVLKNAVTVLLLVYRLSIMCYHLPCCRGEKRKLDDIDEENTVDDEDTDISIKDTKEQEF